MYAYASSLRRNKSSFTDFSGSVNKRTVKRRKIRYERTLLIAVRLFLNHMVICFYASCTDPPAGDGVLFLSVRARSWTKCFTTMTSNRWSQSPDGYNRIYIGQPRDLHHGELHKKRCIKFLFSHCNISTGGSVAVSGNS